MLYLDINLESRCYKCSKSLLAFQTNNYHKFLSNKLSEFYFTFSKTCMPHVRKFERSSPGPAKSESVSSSYHLQKVKYAKPTKHTGINVVCSLLLWDKSYGATKTVKSLPYKKKKAISLKRCSAPCYPTTFKEWKRGGTSRSPKS